MLNIKSLLLSNFRIFSSPIGFKLAPITILTGANSSGKSSLIKSLFLMKNLLTDNIPYKIRFDTKSNLLGSFDQIKNNTTNSPQISIGYGIKNAILNDEISIFFNVEKDGDFDAIVREVVIQGEKETLIYFKFKDDETVTQINFRYFLNKLKDLKEGALRYYTIKGRVEDLAFEDESSFINSETMNKIRTKYFSQEKISFEDYERLNSIFGGYAGPDDSSPDDLMIRKITEIVKDYPENEILYNNDLLLRILNEPISSLTESSLKAIIESDYPDLKYNIDSLGGLVFLNQVITDLKLMSYEDLELTLSEKQVGVVQKNVWVNSNEEIQRLISSHLQFVFKLSPFFEAISEISKGKVLGEIRGFSVPPNLHKLASFISSVYQKVLFDISIDIDKAFYMPLQNLNPGLLIDFNHPLHQLIKDYVGAKYKNQFLDNWLKEFKICDECSFETPVKGLGYSMNLSKAGKKVEISNEGTGVNHLLSMILGLANAKDFISRLNVNDEYNFYPRTIILEEPEANLHPAWQSKLSEMFVDAKNSLGLHFLLETHSEYIIRKLQFLVATKKIDKDEVVIYYFDNPDKSKREKGSPQCFKITFDELGNLSKEFGKGFFDEADNLTIDLFNVNKLNRN